MEKSIDKLISICVLSYNRPDMLVETIHSIHETTTLPFELIINDDNSDKETRDYIQRLVDLQKVSSVILNCGQNKGVGKSLNNCFKVASGEFLVKSDADIKFEMGWDTELVEIINMKNVGCAGIFKYWHDPVNFNKMNPKLQKFHHKLKYYEVDDFVTSVFMIRKNVYEKFGFPSYSEAFAEDVDFKNILKKNGYKLALTYEDYATNFGFGLGKSTLFTKDSTEDNIKVVTIKKEPLIFNREKL